nr:RagB/SusD family nutrient uptake outer membrane protein [uncultured Draconibacterium sp.]
MKNYIKTLLIAVVIVLGTTSCEDYLETNPSSSVSDISVFNTVQGAQAALNGCYYQMESGRGGTDRADDWGYPSHQMFQTVCGEDIIVWGGWYSYDYSMWGHTRGDIFKSSSLWVFYYRLINNTNSVIAYTPGSSGEEAEKNYIMGQAYALRGWAYFQLIRLFQHTYIIAQDMPGVPIYTEPTSDKTKGKPRGTVEQTYQQILDDLGKAETLLDGFDRGTRKNKINSNVCQGFLAEVYLTMNNWEKAAEYAGKARAGFPLTSNEDYLAGFNNVNTASWMWGVAPTKDQNMGDYSPFAMWANWTRNGYTFQCFFLATDFVNMFNAEDIRASQFDYVWDQIYTSMKFRDKDDLLGNIVFMRAEEMLFIEAEALMRMEKETEGKTLLWELQEMRGANKSEDTGDDLIEALLVERRKELYGEGFDWFEIIRNQKPLLRTGNHVNYSGNISFPARSWRFVYQVPFSEIISNDAMVDGIWPNGDQTPFDGVYIP